MSGVTTLAAAHDLVIFDLDGVVYLVDRPIPGAVEAITRLHGGGTPVAYATNNASRRAGEVAALLTGMAVPATPDEVFTSARASAAMLAERFPPGSAILVVGADALRAEVAAVGLVPVEKADQRPVAVVQGYGPNVGWADLAEATVAIRGGALWVATNTDRTLPTGRGPLPGNGALVAALATALDRGPDVVVGKPEPGLFAAAARAAGAGRPLVVGDRLDTDIEGARRAGMDSLLVLTGVSRPADLLAAPPERRPTHVAADLAALFAPEAAGRVNDSEAAGPPVGSKVAGGGAGTSGPAVGADRGAGGEASGWRVGREGRRLRLDGAGEPVAALRVLCRYAWAGEPPEGVDAGSAEAEAALRALGLIGATAVFAA